MSSEDTALRRFFLLFLCHQRGGRMSHSKFWTTIVPRPDARVLFHPVRRLWPAKSRWNIGRNEGTANLLSLKPQQHLTQGTLLQAHYTDEAVLSETTTLSFLGREVLENLVSRHLVKAEKLSDIDTLGRGILTRFNHISWLWMIFVKAPHAVYVINSLLMTCTVCRVSMFLQGNFHLAYGVYWNRFNSWAANLLKAEKTN